MIAPCAVCRESNFMTGLDKARHVKSHPGYVSPSAKKKKAPKPVVPEAVPVAAVAFERPIINAGPAILEDWRQNPNPEGSYGQRAVKMLRPICRTCDTTVRGWWFYCEHDPYITVRETKTQLPVFEDLDDGRKRIIRYDEVIDYKPVPNRVPIPLTPKINGGVGVRMAEGRGFIMPHDLRSPHFPNGIADACEYRECYAQKGLQPYGTPGDEDYPYVGSFCRRVEAALVKLAPKTNHVVWDNESRLQRREEIQAVNFG